MDTNETFAARTKPLDELIVQKTQLEQQLKKIREERLKLQQQWLAVELQLEQELQKRDKHITQLQQSLHAVTFAIRRRQDEKGEHHWFREHLQLELAIQFNDTNALDDVFETALSHNIQTMASMKAVLSNHLMIHHTYPQWCFQNIQDRYMIYRDDHGIPIRIPLPEPKSFSSL